MPLLLDIPFSDRKKAKLLNGEWNPFLRKWYIKKKSDYPKFAEWILKDNTLVPIICDYFYIVIGETKCIKCNKTTSVICFAIDNVLLIKQSTNDNDFPYEVDSEMYLLEYVSDLPKGFSSFLRNGFNYYKRNRKYRNHCQHCNSIQDNSSLFCEYDSVFHIDTAENASNIRLVKVNLKRDLISDFKIAPYYDGYEIEKFSKKFDLGAVF